MSEPPIPTPPPGTQSPSRGRPFGDHPRKLPGGGCGRQALIGCGVVAVLLGIVGIVVIAKAKEMLAWAWTKQQAFIVEALPPDIPADERARLDRGFAAAMENIRSTDVEPPALLALQRQLAKASKISQRGDKLTRDDVLDLLSTLERVGGLLEPEPTGDPAEAGPPEPAGAEPRLEPRP